MRKIRSVHYHVMMLEYPYLLTTTKLNLHINCSACCVNKVVVSIVCISALCMWNNCHIEEVVQ